MAVVIRMKRTGRRNRPSYRISVAESRRPRDGRTLETLGLYDPVEQATEKQVTLNVERARAWLAQGAKPSHTVNNVFRRMGVYEGLERTEPKQRDRSKRKQETKTRAARAAAKQVVAERKEARRSARTAAKLAAKKAAAAEETSEE